MPSRKKQPLEHHLADLVLELAKWNHAFSKIDPAQFVDADSEKKIRAKLEVENLIRFIEARA